MTRKSFEKTAWELAAETQELAEALIEVAEIAMPDSFLASDSRVLKAREVLERKGLGNPSWRVVKSKDWDYEVEIPGGTATVAIDPRYADDGQDRYPFPTEACEKSQIFFLAVSGGWGPDLWKEDIGYFRTFDEVNSALSGWLAPGEAGYEEPEHPDSSYAQEAIDIAARLSVEKFPKGHSPFILEVVARTLEALGEDQGPEEGKDPDDASDFFDPRVLDESPDILTVRFPDDSIEDSLSVGFWAHQDGGFLLAALESGGTRPPLIRGKKQAMLLVFLLTNRFSITTKDIIQHRLAK